MMKSKLKKMRMPESAPDKDLADFGDESEQPGDEANDEVPPMSLGEESAESPSELASFDDDELMAEVEKRGLMGELKSAPAEADESESMLPA